MQNLDYMALEAKSDEGLFDRLIKEQEIFILKCAGKTAHRYITKNDDEWSVSLLAFTQAIKSYNAERGGFLNFAELIIRRRLFDYYRSQNKYKGEVPVNPSVFCGDLDEEADDMYLQINIISQIKQTESNNLKLEIKELSLILHNYGFCFFDLAEVSPKAEKTKKACAKAIAYLLENPLLLNELKISKKLPLKVIERDTKVPRKILERCRRYIIAVTEILSGEYPCLAEYMRFIGKEPSR
ncbi:MAG: RNA polymerase sigma-I factor [Clostridia bacterium]|nr:RNA polymerase sigma-I factor [Clostridia bacterium]